MNDSLTSAVAELASAVPWRSDAVVAVADTHARPIFVSDPARSASLAVTGAHVSSFFAGELSPGDAVISNDPFVGASHVTEFTLVRWGHRGTAIVRMRLPDIGGFELGGLAPQSFDTWGEGARFPALRIVVAGAPRTEALDLVGLNSRTPMLLRSGLAAMDAVAAGLAEEVDRSGAVDAAPLRSAASDATSALGTLKPGRYTAQEQVAFPMPGAAPVIRVELIVGQGRTRLSFAGSSAQLEAPLNSPAPHTLDCCLSALADALPGFPLAPGALDPIEIDPGVGTITGAVLPAITGLAPFHTARAVRCAVTEALQSAGAPGSDPDGWWQAAGRTAYEARVDPATLRIPVSEARAFRDLEKQRTP